MTPPIPSATIRIADDWKRPDAALVAEFGRYPVANIGDAMDRLGMCDGGISPVWTAARCAGSALPILTTAGDNAAVIQALDHIQPGDVVVVNGFGHRDRALVGGQLTRRFAVRGAAGAVIDGAVRDSAEIHEQHFPVFARASNPAGPFKNGPGVIGEPVAVGCVVCAAGDIVVGDDDGVIIVPLDRAERILERLLQVAEHEAALTAEVRSAY